MQTNTEKPTDNPDDIKQDSGEIRLEKLKQEVLNLNDKRLKAQKDASYKGLEESRSFAEFIISSNASDEEIAVAKRLLSDLDSIKQGSQTEIRKLKESSDENKEKKEIESKLKENGGKPKLEMLFAGVETDLVKSASSILFSKYSEKLIKYNLSQDHLHNVSIGITQKMIDAGIFSNLTGGLNGRLTRFNEKAKEGKWLEMLDDGEKSEDRSVDVLKNLEKSMDQSLKVITIKFEENPRDPLLPLLLSNPKEIAAFRGGKIKEGIGSLTQDDLLDYLAQTNSKILALDKKLLGAQKLKDDILDSIATSPDFMQKGMMKFLSFLLDIPFIGDLVRGFLGKTGTKEEVLNGLSEDMLKRKSVNELRRYGIKHTKDGASTDSEKKPGIGLLKDKDLRKADIKKLDGLFVFCKSRGINANDKSFWMTIFSDEPKFSVKGTDGKEHILKLNRLDIGENDFGPDKQPKDSFFYALNTIQEFKPSANPTEKKIVPTGPTALAAAPQKTKQNPRQHKAETAVLHAQEVLMQPKSISYIKEKSQIIADGKVYGISLKDSRGSSISIDNMEYMNGKIILSGSQYFISGSKTFSEDEVRKAFIQLASTGKYIGKSDDGNTLQIEKA